MRQYGTKYYSTERKYHGLLNVTAQILFQEKVDLEMYCYFPVNRLVNFVKVVSVIVVAL